MADLHERAAMAEAEANAEVDRRREAVRVEFLRSWVEQNGAAVVARTLRVGEVELVESVEAGELLEESPAYRAVEGWMAGTGYWEVWDSGAGEGVEGGGGAATAGYPAVADYFGRGMETVADARSRYLMQVYDQSGGDLAVVQAMSGLSRNQFTQAARRIRAGGALEGRLAELIDARIERERVARGRVGEATGASQSDPGAQGQIRRNALAGGRRRMRVDVGWSQLGRRPGRCRGARDGDNRVRRLWTRADERRWVTCDCRRCCGSRRIPMRTSSTGRK